MSRVDEHNSDSTDSSEWIEVEEDELMRRLRNLEWPKARPELRERCWREIQRRLAEQQAEQEARGRFTRDTPTAPVDLDLDRNYEFSRRRVTNDRVAVPQSWSRSYQARATAISL